ncbi:hypothetical protein PMKS-003255 [Pichia membranifaciens]|uniref:alpha-1,2-Mannosidase n=1 Tax=Pichia membranifaciens TaxID=4926 RepID=A0A1Q2YK58_9ASCO|nr:hypothetical protein PMKS-003255 [Pichia membranifaciens]
MNLSDAWLRLVLLLSIFSQHVLAKSQADSPFEKYSYRSNFTDKELFHSTFTKDHLQKLKAETKALFNYAWDKYMDFGYPFDEVSPLTCKPNKRDMWDEFNTVKNDAMGNFSITFFDAMDTFIIMGDRDKFHESVSTIKKTYTDFAIDSTIQIFETNIRLLGSLLTAHLYAIDPRRGLVIPEYDGFLLKLAYDLGKRLVLSFSHTEDNYKFEGDDVLKYFVFSYPRTNLLHGTKDVPYGLKYEQCTAGVTSLTLEFSLLSRLTNDTLFEDVSRRAVTDFWGRRTKFDLIPMAFDTYLRTFTDSITGIGASIDSFYEYALKYSILFDDDFFYEIWQESYKALLTHSQNKIGIFTNLNVNNGLGATEWIDSLGAFFPGLQVLAGDVSNSIELHRIFFKLWNNYGAIPERWNFMPLRSEGYFQHLGRPYKDGDLIEGLDIDSTNEVLTKNSVGLEWYPLRPELIESTYHLYTATKDPFYLRLGEDFLERFREHYIAPCGFSGSLDILNDRRQDRQESFVLSETLKYLYLLFDVDNAVQQGNMVFTTEGHPLWFDKKLWNFDPIKKLDLEEMNIYNKTETANPGFLGRLLQPRRFYLNKEFDELRTVFYEDANKVNPILYRISDMYALQRSETGELAANDYGKFMRVNKTDYDQLRKYEKTRLAFLNASLRDSGDLELDEDFLGLGTCDIINRQSMKLKTSPVQSGVLKDSPEFYRLDWEYSMTLRKPTYLADREPLELDPHFYQRYVGSVSGAGGAICRAEQTTREWEALMSSDDTFSVAPIYKFRGRRLDGERASARMASRSNHKRLVPREGDIFLAELEGLRLRLEELAVGDLDSRGHIISQASYDEMVAAILRSGKGSNNAGEVHSVVRLTKLNGLQIGSDTLVWVYAGSQLLNNSNSVATVGRHLVLNGQVVTNVLVQ